MSVFSDFQQVALRQPDAPAVVTLDGAVSYSTVLGLADRIARRSAERVYKHPSEIILVEKLPILPSGKLGRQRLAADYTSSLGG